MKTSWKYSIFFDCSSKQKYIMLFMIIATRQEYTSFVQLFSKFLILRFGLISNNYQHFNNNDYLQNNSRLFIIQIIFTMICSTIVLYKTSWIKPFKAEGNKSETRRLLFERIRNQTILFELVFPNVLQSTIVLSKFQG